MRGDTPHRVHRDGPPGHRLVAATGPVRPRDIDRDFVFERGVGEFRGDTPDLRCVDPDPFRDRVRRIGGVEIAFHEQVKCRHDGATVRGREFADHGRARPGIIGRHERVGVAIETQRLRGFRIEREQTVIGRTGFLDHEPAGVRIAREIVPVDALGTQQFVDQGEHEQAVGAGPQADPFVGNRGVSRAHRVHGYELRIVA